jgi:hypothetical protein
MELNLSEDAFVHILTFCTAATLVDVGICSKSIYATIHDESEATARYIWKELFRNYVGQASMDNVTSWKNAVYDAVTWKWCGLHNSVYLSENNKKLANPNNDTWIAAYCEKLPIRKDKSEKTLTWELVLNTINHNADGNYFGIIIGVASKATQLVGQSNEMGLMLCNGYIMSGGDSQAYLPNAPEHSYKYLEEPYQFVRGDVIGVKFTCHKSGECDMEFFKNGISLGQIEYSNTKYRTIKLSKKTVIYPTVSLINGGSVTLRFPRHHY